MSTIVQTFSTTRFFLIFLLFGTVLSVTCDVDFKDDGTGSCIQSGNPCATNYHDDGSGEKCIPHGGQCSQNFHDDGSGQICLAPGETCAVNFKDDGTGNRCIRKTQVCSAGYRDAGNGTCIAFGQPCATKYRDDGTGLICIPQSEPCAQDYIDQGAGICTLNCTELEKDNGQGFCIGIDENCAVGYTSDDPNTNDNCNVCDLFFKNNGAGTCVQVLEPCAIGYKNNGQYACVLLTDPCAIGYTTQPNLNNCQQCATGYRDDGLGFCALLTDPCAFGFKDDGKKKCIDIFFDCAEGFKDDGYGSCINSTASCGPNFQDDGKGNCKLILQTDILSLTISDSSGNQAKCDPLCSVCNLGGQCITCKVGYALRQTTKICVPCDNCLTCNQTNPKQCTSCFPPQVLNRTSKACVSVSCPVESCLQCNLDATCKFCFEGFALRQNKCVKCQVQNCKSCPTSLDTCDVNSCFDGYVYFEGKKKCLPCTSGCQNCKLTDISECVGCNPGYYPSIIGNKSRCSRCFNLCQECLNITTCKKCSNGFVVSRDGSQCFLKCSDSCATCNNINPNLCLTCYSGSTLNRTTGKCITNLTCNSTGTCSSCSEGFVIFSNRCYKCTYNVSNCTACTYEKLDVCARCQTGFYLQNEICNKCVGNCSSCMGLNACARCDNGFYLVKEDSSPTGICQKCNSPCSTCSGSPFICTSCPLTFALNGSSCISPNRVNVAVKLAIQMEQFIQYYDSLLQWFVSKVSQFKGSNQTSFSRKDIILHAIKSGSIDINAGIQLQNANNVVKVASGLSAAMSSGGQKIDGLLISGTAIGTTDSPSLNIFPSSSKNNANIILPIVIPLGILLVIAIIVIVVKIHNKKYQDRKYLSTEDTMPIKL